MVWKTYCLLKFTEFKCGNKHDSLCFKMVLLRKFDVRASDCSSLVTYFCYISYLISLFHVRPPSELWLECHFLKQDPFTDVSTIDWTLTSVWYRLKNKH